MRSLKALLCCSFLFQTGCGLIEEYLANAIESNVVPGAISEVFSGVQQNLIAQTPPNPLDGHEICEGFSIPECSAENTKTLNLEGCSIQDPFKLSGQLSFEFPESTDCVAAADNDSVIRTFDVELSGYKSVEIRITGEPDSEHTTKIPTTGVGQQILTKVGAGPDWFYESTGSHRRGGLNQLGIRPLDLTTHTPLPFAVSADLADLTRITLDGSETDVGGKIQIYNHALGYNVELSNPNPSEPLVFEQCSCPTQGKLSGTAQGSSFDSESERFMELEFTGCGIGNFTFRGKTHENVQLDMCAGI